MRKLLAFLAAALLLAGAYLALWPDNRPRIKAKFIVPGHLVNDPCGIVLEGDARNCVPATAEEPAMFGLVIEDGNDEHTHVVIVDPLSYQMARVGDVTPL